MTLHHGDCLEVLRTMPDNSVDSIVTDPPYGLSFMGKKWDYDVPSEDIWRECLRVLKPGGHLLAFAGTRTQHRMAVRIEDAGFEIRDMLAWVYGSGFPKSLDVSKAIDKVDAAEEQERRRLAFTAWVRSQGVTSRQIDEATGTNMGGHYTTAASQPRIMTREHLDACRHLLGDVPEWVEREADIRSVESRNMAEREVVGVQKNVMSGWDMDGGTRFTDRNITAPATPEAQQWAGWGTALKPALEPITVARKPLGEKTVAANVLAHGTGALNIDGCRVGTEKVVTTNGKGFKGSFEGGENNNGGAVHEGRWPANLIHDGSDEVVGLFPVTGASSGRPRRNTAAAHNATNSMGNSVADWTTLGHDDNGGSAARFFYCAKASKKDRDEGCDHLPEHQEGLQLPRGKCPDCGTWKNSGELKCKCGGEWEMTSNPPPKARNNHPTVKPTALMRYLCRLVTPPEGIVLDPFMGSGSTGKAAMLEGFQFIGIERDADYLEIAKARIKQPDQPNQPELFQP
jgi:DNA modification methylase